MNIKTYFTRSYLKRPMVRCYVFSILRYGSERWNLDSQPRNSKKYRGFRNVCVQENTKNILDSKNNKLRSPEENAQRINLLYNVKRRKIQYPGHEDQDQKGRNMKIRIRIDWKIQGKISIGRQRNFGWYIFAVGMLRK